MSTYVDMKDLGEGAKAIVASAQQEPVALLNDNSEVVAYVMCANVYNYIKERKATQLDFDHHDVLVHESDFIDLYLDKILD